MVLHDLNQACRYDDYLIAVKQGRIVTAGEPQ
jgi:iron complex transport system ATP-binding protein